MSDHIEETKPLEVNEIIESNVVDIKEDIKEDVKEDIKEDVKEDIKEDVKEDLKEDANPNKRKMNSSYGPVPEGMSKSQWKKICKRKQWESEKDQHRENLRAKKQQKRQERRAKLQEYFDKGEAIPDHLKRKPRRPTVEQVDSGIKIVVDCSFDDLMNEKEVISLSNQIVRSYSANRNSKHFARIECTSFDKRLKSRFNNKLKDTHYENWNHVKFNESDPLKTLSEEEKKEYIYLSADATETLETLEPGKTYCVGGIVDKGRYKKLCLNKAQELNIVTKKLPIGEFIKINGRTVLTTTHVIELMLKYFENKDWKASFEHVLPPRKLGTNGEEGEEEDENEAEEGEKLAKELAEEVKEDTEEEEAKEVTEEEAK